MFYRDLMSLSVCRSTLCDAYLVISEISRKSAFTDIRMVTHDGFGSGNLSVHNMHRNVMRPASNITVIAAKPPKPPCWRDFVASPARLTNLNEAEFTDISKVAKTSNESFSSDGQPISKSGKPKRIRSKIHRTRSQFTIEENDLPEETLTVSLAETNPGDLGLRRQPAFVFQEDNNRKCQTWLEGIEACQPLEDISAASHSEEDAEGVSIEVPDNTSWYDQTELRPPNNSSASGSECETRRLSRRSKNMHRSRSYDTRHEKLTKGHTAHEGKTTSLFIGEKQIQTG